MLGRKSCIKNVRRHASRKHLDGVLPFTRDPRPAAKVVRVEGVSHLSDSVMSRAANLGGVAYLLSQVELFCGRQGWVFSHLELQ